MKEQLIKFKTAKLAKEKGFNIPCLQAYRVWRESIRKSDKNPLEEIQAELEPYTQFPIPEITYFNQSKQHTLAPTQSLLQKWLREEHGYIVIVVPLHSLDKYSVSVYGNGLGEEVPCPISLSETQGERFDKWEEALEEGLFEALKLIK